MAIQVTKSDLSKKVEEGWKRKALAEHYGLPETQMAQLLKDAGLKIRKFHAPRYVLVDDVAEVLNESDSVQIIEEAGEETKEIQSEQAIEEAPVDTKEAESAIQAQAGW